MAPSRLPRPRRGRDVAAALAVFPRRFDLLFYTEEELAEECADPYSFMSSVMSSARPLYVRGEAGSVQDPGRLPVPADARVSGGGHRAAMPADAPATVPADAVSRPFVERPADGASALHVALAVPATNGSSPAGGPSAVDIALATAAAKGGSPAGGANASPAGGANSSPAGGANASPAGGANAVDIALAAAAASHAARADAASGQVEPTVVPRREASTRARRLGHAWGTSPRVRSARRALGRLLGG